MGRRKKNLLVPGARDALDKLREQVLQDKAQGTASLAKSGQSIPVYSTAGTVMLSNEQDGRGADASKSNSGGSIEALAKSLGIPYHSDGNNGDMKAKEAGKLGGEVGGAMVKRLIAAAQQQMQADQVRTK